MTGPQNIPIKHQTSGGMTGCLLIMHDYAILPCEAIRINYNVESWHHSKE